GRAGAETVVKAAGVADRQCWAKRGGSDAPDRRFSREAGQKLTDIYVDGDACPVREEVYRVAARLKVKVLVVSNGSRPIRPDFEREHGPRRRYCRCSR